MRGIVLFLVVALPVFSKAYAGSLDEAASKMAKVVGGNPFFLKVSAINLKVNAHLTYVEDQQLFGLSEKWVGPEQSWQLAAGDCEEFVMLKEYFLLKAGIAPESMHYLIHNEHILLLVEHEDEALLLDNRTNVIKRVKADADSLAKLPSRADILARKRGLVAVAG
ncbi:transglutaminase-like cysteine peptidase [Thiomicrorhabdus cannonii]|uniref:transglutaminase-like cysteine peptidase n=1 Tax=Thiomicrorhabdus cannonii TaxID=2748011 RepID=UPI0015C18D45|nr:transglutaminase-like cysteine peptidase [Thiomicrorhabdus cannonii]